ncbi:MAG: VRR-NUC domain-containing protein [Phycisphaerae bacterium]|jgi:hypothetical protein
MSEHQEQALVVEYLQSIYPLALFWATPNGASLSGRGRAMNKLKAEGCLPGVSDLIIFEPRGGYSAMFLEMKKQGGGSGASENQLWFIRQIEERGAYGVVANGFVEAQVFIDDYLCGRVIHEVI